MCWIFTRYVDSAPTLLLYIPGRHKASRSINLPAVLSRLVLYSPPGSYAHTFVSISCFQLSRSMPLSRNSIFLLLAMASTRMSILNSFRSSSH